MRARLVFVAATALVVVSCAGQTLVVLKDPKTGQFTQCQDDARVFGSADRVAACAASYERNGWVRQ